MLEINLKEQNGIFNSIKLIDAFKLKDKDLTFVLLYKNEIENNLMKIYISKYADGVLNTITDQEWAEAKTAMYNIVSNKEEYEVVSIPNVITSVGVLKPCLIATVAHFENHYKKIEEQNSNVKEEANTNFRFTNGSTEWKNEQSSLDSIINKANELTEEESDEGVHENYKVQKEKMINMISKTMDNILESKNKEIVDLQSIVDKLDKDLRKSELEKKKAMDIIDMYHEKIQKLYKLVKENREDK